MRITENSKYMLDDLPSTHTRPSSEQPGLIQEELLDCGEDKEAARLSIENKLIEHYVPVFSLDKMIQHIGLFQEDNHFLLTEQLLEVYASGASQADCLGLRDEVIARVLKILRRILMKTKKAPLPEGYYVLSTHEWITRPVHCTVSVGFKLSPEKLELVALFADSELVLTSVFANARLDQLESCKRLYEVSTSLHALGLDRSTKLAQQNKPLQSRINKANHHLVPRFNGLSGMSESVMNSQSHERVAWLKSKALFNERAKEQFQSNHSRFS